MNIIFFGSDDFAGAHLKALMDSEHSVAACVTQPDRPKGRGMPVVVSPVKECALFRKVPVLQPGSLKDPGFLKELKNFGGDLFVVIAYGKFLPAEILTIPPRGAVNVHASLLPKYRGAAPIHWAVINGEKETGISIIQMNERMDAGDVLAQMKIAVEENETAVTLRAKMIEEGPEFLLKTVADLRTCVPRKQDAKEVTFAPKLTKELGAIEWGKSAVAISHLVRGLLNWPGAYTVYKGKRLKILEASPLENGVPGQAPGTVLGADKEGIVVSTGDGRLLLQKVHLQDSRPMEAHRFVIGHEIKVGDKLR